MDDRSIDVRISSLDGMMTMITGAATPEPRQDEPGRTLGSIHVLLLVRDAIHSQIDSISPRGLVHQIIRYPDDLTAKNPAALSPMNSVYLDLMTNLTLTQSGRFNQCIIRPLLVKLMKFPKSEYSNRSRSSKLSFSIF